jgi:AcrR family transcriptional regulator
MGEMYLPALQARSRETASRILDAAEELLRAEGLRGFLIGRVAAEAQRGVATIYDRFGDRDGLLLAVFDRYLRRGADQNARSLHALAVSNATLAEVCLSLASGLVRRYRRDGKLLQALRSFAGQPAGESLAQHAMSVAREALLMSRSAILARSGEIRRSDPVEAIDIVMLMIGGAAELNAAAPARHRTDTQVASLLAKAAVAYLISKDD